ncbi:hypothetical protein L7F22_051335 [Adiantum nelumboides]|nr:hypothetical protein [Adiantum nelumboides]
MANFSVCGAKKAKARDLSKDDLDCTSLDRATTSVLCELPEFSKMQGGLQVFPTAPAGMRQPEDGVTPPANFPPLAEGGDHGESLGKPKSPLGKMKHKARKLREKIKKVTGSNTTASPTASPGHGDTVDEHRVDQGERAYPPHPPPEYEHVDDEEDDEEDEETDHILLGDDKSKFDQVRVLGATIKPGDGSEVEVHGGVPASAVSTTPTTSDFNAPTVPFKGVGLNAPVSHHDDKAEFRDNGPISPYKSSGPPGTLQAAPTEYHYTPTDDDQLLQGDLKHDVSPDQGRPRYFESASSPTIEHRDVLDPSYSKGPSTDIPYEQPKSEPRLSDNVLSSQGLPQMSEDTSLEASTLGTTPSSDVNSSKGRGNSSLEEHTPPDDIVKPNPEFGRSSSPMHNKIAVINEDLPAEMRFDARLTPEDHSGQQSLFDKSVPENVPLNFDEEKSDYKRASNAVNEPPFSLPAQEKTSTNAGQKFDQSEQNEHEPFVGAGSGGSHGREGLLGRNYNDEDLKSTDKSVFDYAPLARATDAPDVDTPLDTLEARPSTPLADETLEPTSAFTRDVGFKDSQDGRRAGGVNAFGADEDEKSLVTALGNQASGQRSGHESLLGVPRDDVREQQPLLSQAGSESDARAELPVSDNFSNDDSPFDQNVQPAGREQETWGKWSADKLNAAKDTVSTGLLGSEKRADDDSQSMVTTTPGHNDSETPLATAVGNESRNCRDNDNLEKNDNITGLAVGTTSSLGADEGKSLHTNEGIEPRSNAEANAQENVKEDEEYYDPNNADHGQFQEGFARGTGEAEEEILNGTLTGSAIGKLQGLTDVVANKFGLSGSSHRKPFDADNVEEPNAGQRAEDESLSAPVGNENSRQYGAVDPLKHSEGTTLNYSENSPSPVLTSEEDESQRKPAIPLENEHVNTTGSQQQSGGAFQGLRNVLASKLGYGVQEKPAIQKEQSVDDESGKHAAAAKEGYRGSDEGESMPSQQQSGSAVQGLRNVVASKLGDGELMQKPTADNTLKDDEEPPTQKEQTVYDEEPPTQKEQTVYDESGQHAAAVKEGYRGSDEGESIPSQQQSGSAFQGLRNVVASKLGYGESMPKPTAGNTLKDDEEPPAQKEQTVYDESGEHAPAVKEGYRGSDEGESMPSQQQSGSALQGLRNVVASKLGDGESMQKPTADNTLKDDEEPPTQKEQTVYDEEPPTQKEQTVYDESGQHAAAVKEGYRGSDEGESIPSQQQSGSAFQGLRNVVASKFGYGESMPKPTAGYTLKGDEEPPAQKEQTVYDESGEHAPAVKEGYKGSDEGESMPSQQQSGSAFQGLRNVVASKLGYGESMPKPIIDTTPKNADGIKHDEEWPTQKEQTVYDESGEHAAAVKEGYRGRAEGESMPSQQQSGSALQGLRNIVASKLGYGESVQKPTANNTPKDTYGVNRDEGVAISPVRDEKVAGVNSPSGYTQKIFDTAATARDYLSSKVGTGFEKQEKPEDRNVRYTEEEKPTSAV